MKRTDRKTRALPRHFAGSPVFLLLIAFFIVPVAFAAEPLSVFTSIEPEAFLVERIGGDAVSVSVLVTSGQSPHTFDPSPGVMARLAKCDIFFRIGMAFEDRLLKKLSGSGAPFRIVNLREGIPLRYMAGSGGSEAAREPDPHIWMSPRRMITMSGRIRDVLSEALPERQAFFRHNWQRLRDDLERLDREVKAALAPFAGRRVLVFHPAYGYFLEDYGLQQVAVEQEGKSPSARQLSGIIAMARREKITAIFVQPQFSRQTARVIADGIGGSVVTFDPLAHDYIANLRKAMKALVSVLSSSAAAGGGSS